MFPSVPILQTYLFVSWSRIIIIFLFSDDTVSPDSKPWSSHSVHGVKSEYTLPESSVPGSGTVDPGAILPDSSQTLPPLMHMGYAVSRHAGGEHLN